MAYTQDQIYTAIRAADKAGDADAVRTLSAQLQAPAASSSDLSGGVDDNPLGHASSQFDGTGVDPNNADGYVDPTTGRLTVNITPDAKPDTRPTSFWQGALEGAEKPLDNAASLLANTGVGQAVDKFGQSLGLPSAQETSASHAAQIAAAPVQGSGAGRFVGNVAALSTLPGGVLTQGAIGGALNSDDQSLGGLVTGAAEGMATGKLAELGLRSAAQVAAPAVSDGLRTLMNAGIRVTPGMAARSVADNAFEAGNKAPIANWLARSEDRAISTPFVGDSIVGARNQSFRDFGRATLNRALEPIGQALPDGVNGRKAVQWAGDKLSAEYDRILPNIKATGDWDFVQDLAAIHQHATTLGPGRADQFNSILDGLGRFWQQGSQLDGTALKDIEERLGERVRSFARSTSADERDLGTSLGEVQSAVRELAARQNPQYATELRNVNKGWAGLTQAESAAGTSRGNITPAGYSQSVKQSSATVRRRGYARGQALNQDLSDAASDILPSQIADSGTAGRWQQSNIPALAFGAAQSPVYAAARAATPLLTRQQFVSPEIAALLRLGARHASPIAVAGTSGLIGSNP